jgi:S1-C subfamily serine protease
MLLVAVALVWTGVAVGAQDWAAIHEQMERSILPMKVTGADGMTGTCSAVVIADNRVLSAAHCTQDKASYTIDNRDAQLIRKNDVLDLAAFKVNLRGARPVLLATERPRPGSPIAVVGFPFGAETLAIQIGNVARHDDAPSTWLAVDIIPGNSGGAVVDANGNFVGLTQGFLYIGPAHLGYVARLDVVRDFIQDLPPDKS